MLTDNEVTQHVEEEFRPDPQFDATDIAATVKDGVVTLVHHYNEKAEAESAAKRVAGVVGVANDIEVRLRDVDDRPDPDSPGRGGGTARTLVHGTALPPYPTDLFRGYFDRMAKALLGKRAEIEVASLELGDQIEAEWVALLGVTYDPKSDVLEVALDGLDHLVPKPRQIYIDEGLAGLDSFEVIDHAGVRHIVRLREPLMLPSPSTASR